MNSFTMRLKQLTFLLVAFAVLFPACQKDDPATVPDTQLVKNEDAAVPVAWMKLFLELDRYAAGFRPGPCPRSLAYINMAAYESVMHGMPDFKSLQHLYPTLKLPSINSNEEYHWPTVVNAVYATSIKHFVPGNILLSAKQIELQFKVLELERDFYNEFEPKVGAKVMERSKAHGEAVANAIWEWSKTDSFGDQAYLDPRPSGYTPPSGPGLWQPTPPDYNAALFPYWGKVRCMAIHEEDKLSNPPLNYSEDPNSLFFTQANEVKNSVNNLDFNNQWIAEFWSDDFVGEMFSPPGRWISIAVQVIEKENASLETALYALAKVSFALNDAGVACWNSKYTYNVERPVTYIRRVMDPNWLPHWDSNPSFPAYPSGHATFGAAAAEVLSHIFGYNYAMTDNSHKDRTEFYGMPRSYETFYEMAEENAYSRIPLGVHFRMDAEEGVRLGFKIGRKVNEMPFKK
ncbi:MAG: vanadium-dependent haloperoxidase [Saprospiraceae bacterium]